MSSPTKTTYTRELTGDTGAHIFVPLSKGKDVKKALHTALSAAGHGQLPQDPSKAHITAYLGLVFEDVDPWEDGWLINSISADNYQVLTEHVAPALCGLVTTDPADDWQVENPYIAFEFADGDQIIWEDWDMTAGGLIRRSAESKALV